MYIAYEITMHQRPIFDKDHRSSTMCKTIYYKQSVCWTVLQEFNQLYKCTCIIIFSIIISIFNFWKYESNSATFAIEWCKTEKNRRKVSCSRHFVSISFLKSYSKTYKLTLKQKCWKILKNLSNKKYIGIKPKLTDQIILKYVGLFVHDLTTLWLRN